jgi:putative resolvase
LDRQVARLTTWTTGQGVTVAEVGSGMNGRRPRLTRLLADPQVGTIVFEHPDRLARFAVEQLQCAQGRRILVADPAETTDDLVGGRDDVLTSFCPRLNGRRGTYNRTMRAVICAKRPPNASS